MDIGFAAKIVTKIITSVVNSKIGSELGKELIGTSIDGVSEKSITEINNLINGKKSKIEYILSKENMRAMDIAEENIDFIVDEIKDLLSEIEITDEVLIQCEYNKQKMKEFLWRNYISKNKNIECEGDMKKGLYAIANAIIRIKCESGYDLPLMIDIKKNVDDTKKEVQKNAAYMTESFDKLERNILKIDSEFNNNFNQDMYIKKNNGEFDIQSELNIIELLQDKFDELFPAGKRDFGVEETGENSIRKMLYNIIGTNLVNCWSNKSNKYKLDLEDEWSREKERELVEDDSLERVCIGEWLDPIHSFSGSEEKYFSITDYPGIVTLVYMVNKKINPQTKEWWFEPIFLEYSETEQDDRTMVRTYFVDNPSSEGNPLVFLSFIDDKECVSVDTGFLDYEDVKISQSPEIMPLENSLFHAEGYGEIRRFLSNREKEIIIIDPKFHIPLTPKEIYDDEKGEYKTYVDLQARRKYFAFRLSSDSKGLKKASAHMLGYNYYIGQYGLNQNWLKAAEWLMQSDEPEDVYYLGIIFMQDKLLHDISLARKYLTKATELGIGMAQKLLKEL